GEDVSAVVAADERVVGGEGWAGAAAGEVDGAGVARRGIPEGVERRDGGGEGATRGPVRRSAYGQRCGRAGRDCDRAARPGDGSGDGVGGGDGAVAGLGEGDAVGEGVA